MRKNIVITILCILFLIAIVKIRTEKNPITERQRIFNEVWTEYEQAQYLIADNNNMSALKHFIRVVEIAPKWRDGLKGMAYICILIGEKETGEFFRLLYSKPTEPTIEELGQITNCLKMLKVKYEIDTDK